jgi:cytochrome o ubiquinol oxidase subunit 1
VQGTDAYWAMKEAGRATTQAAARPRYEPIEVPRNTPVGVILALFAVILGFSLIWHIWWLAIVGLIGMAGAGLSHAWSMEREMVIPADEVAAFERARAPLQTRGGRS